MRLLKVQAARGNCLAAAGVYFFLPRVVGEFLSCDDGGTHGQLGTLCVRIWVWLPSACVCGAQAPVGATWDAVRRGQPRAALRCVCACGCR